MGIQGLTPFLRKRAPGCLQERTEDALREKRVAIDVAIVLYKGLAREEDVGFPGHLQVLLGQVEWYRGLGALRRAPRGTRHRGTKW